MQHDKASLMLEGRSFLQWTLDALAHQCQGIVLVKRDRAQTLPPYQAAVPIYEICDQHAGWGPLESLRSGLEFIDRRCASPSLVFACGVDSPLLRPTLIARLWKEFESRTDPAQLAVIPHQAGRLHPLLAVYSTKAQGWMHQMLESGERRLQRLPQFVPVLSVAGETLRHDDPNLQSFWNVNTPEELEQVRKMTQKPQP